LPLSEKVRIEIFIPDSSNNASRDLLEEFAGELSYAFGGCTEVPASGKYRALDGRIVPDKVTILFSDAPLRWEQDRLALAHYIDRVKSAAQSVLQQEEALLISVFSVCHAD
jgi:hypothetical protein